MKRAWKKRLIALSLAFVSATTPILLTLNSTTATTPHSVVTTEVVKDDTITQAPSSTKPTEKEKSDPTPPNLAAAIQRRQKLLEADHLYLAGQIPEEEKIYREVKAPFVTHTETPKRPEPILDPAQLPPAGKVYWRETQAGAEAKLQSRMMVPLRLLVEEYPQFIPGHLRLDEVLQY